MLEKKLHCIQMENYSSFIGTLYFYNDIDNQDISKGNK